MSLRLKEIFDSCPWENKFVNQLPVDDSKILFKWYDEDADKARRFFDDLSLTPKECTEVSPLARRSLFFGRDQAGKWMLCVHEIPNEDFDPSDDGRGHGCRIDPLRTI